MKLEMRWRNDSGRFFRGKWSLTVERGSLNKLIDTNTKFIFVAYNPDLHMTLQKSFTFFFTA